MIPRMDPAVRDWMSRHVLPYEGELRVRLGGFCGAAGPGAHGVEIDDIIQEVYFRILKLAAVDYIREPKDFVMQMAKNILVDKLRRDAIVDIAVIADLERLGVEDPGPSPERVAAGKIELGWIVGLIGALPERCRQVFVARKVFGYSQTETADQLSLSENVVEKETMRGVKLLSRMVAGTAPAAEGHGDVAEPGIARVMERP